jgi:hypothetical protein
LLPRNAQAVATAGAEPAQLRAIVRVDPAYFLQSRRMMMRMLPFALAALVAGVAATPAAAAPAYPWCARYSSSGGECSFNTFEQCMEDISGIGGVCQANPGFNTSNARPGAYDQAPEYGSRDPRYVRH